jgi:hypothetical protein
MKTKLLSLFLLVSILSFGQTPVNSFYGANNSSFQLLTAASSLDHSAAGANQTWNFNQLIPLGTSVHTYATPTATESSTYTGTTNVIITTSTNGSTVSTGKLFTKNIANEVSITGLTGADLIANFNTNNATLGNFPMNYGFSNNDTSVAGSFTYTTYNGTFTGSLVTSVDAHGTLTLNDTGNGSYTGNVTRLKTVLNLSLNYGFFNNIGTVTQTSYSYYDSTDGTNNPIFRSVTTTAVVPLLSINQSDTTLERFVAVLLNVPDTNLSSLWVKNPIEDSIEINSNISIENATVTVVDMFGKVVYRNVNENITENYKIPISLNKGMYIITLSNDKVSFTKKIIKN